MVSEAELLILVDQARTSVQEVTSYLCAQLPLGYVRLYSELDHAAHMVRNIGLLTKRMCPASIQLKDIGIETFQKIQSGFHDNDLLMQLSDKQAALHEQLELDFESVYMYGTVLLDQLADASTRICGLDKPCRFSKLIEQFMKAQLVKRPLQELWDANKNELWWHYAKFRLFRDKFVQHHDEPYTYGFNKTLLGTDFQLSRLRHPSLSDAEEKQMLESVYSIVLKSSPELHRRIHGLNGMELFRILSEHFESISFKDWNTLHGYEVKYGMLSPSFDDVIKSILELTLSISKFLLQQCKADVKLVKP